MQTFEALRIKRFKNRVKRRDLARRVGCHESWIARLEDGGYHGPAAQEWREKYEAALEDLIEEQKAASK